MNWHLRIANRARKVLGKLPAKDRRLILAALEAMSQDPFSGDFNDLLTREQDLPPTDPGLSSLHRDLDSLLFRRLAGGGVAGVDVASYADARVVGQHSVQAATAVFGAISHCHLAGVQIIFDASAAT